MLWYGTIKIVGGCLSLPKILIPRPSIAPATACFRQLYNSRMSIIRCPCRSPRFWYGKLSRLDSSCKRSQCMRMILLSRCEKSRYFLHLHFAVIILDNLWREFIRISARSTANLREDDVGILINRSISGHWIARYVVIGARYRSDRIFFRAIRLKRKRRSQIDLSSVRGVHSVPANLHTRTHSVHGSQPEVRMVVYMQHLLVDVVELRFLPEHTGAVQLSLTGANKLYSRRIVAVTIAPHSFL